MPRHEAQISLSAADIIGGKDTTPKGNVKSPAEAMAGKVNDRTRKTFDGLNRNSQQAANIGFRYATGLYRSAQAISEAWGNPFAAAAFKSLGDVTRTGQAETEYWDISETPRYPEWEAEDYPFALNRYSGGENNDRVLLIVPPAMSDERVLDIKDNSFVAAAIKEGFDVFMATPGDPGSEHSDVGLSDLALKYLDKSIDRIREIKGPDVEINGYGLCQGGTELAGYNAMNLGRIHNQVLAVPALNNSGDNEFLRMLRDKSNTEAVRERIRRNYGVLPGRELGYGMALRNKEKYLKDPHERVAKDVRRGNDRGVEVFELVQNWLKWNDEKSVTGKTFEEIRAILVDGKWVWNGVPVDLTKTEANTQVWGAERDDIIDINSVREGCEVIGGEFRSVKGGHVYDLVMGPPAYDAWAEMWAFFRRNRKNPTTAPLQKAA